MQLFRPGITSESRKFKWKKFYSRAVNKIIRLKYFPTVFFLLSLPLFSLHLVLNPWTCWLLTSFLGLIIWKLKWFSWFLTKEFKKVNYNEKIKRNFFPKTFLKISLITFWGLCRKNFMGRQKLHTNFQDGLIIAGEARFFTWRLL